MIVVGIDPGESFGLAVMRDDKLVYAYQGSPEGGYKVLQTIFTNCPDDERLVIAIENYVLPPNAGRRTRSSNTLPMLGVIEEMANNGNVPLVKQTSSDAKAAWSNKLLRRAGLYINPARVGQADSHDANSALRHALLWLMRNKATIVEKLLRDTDLV